MLMKLLIVYNTCGISGRENTESYIRSLQSIVDQNTGHTAVSACLNKTPQLLKIKEKFPRMDIFDIRDKVPISVSFNLTVDKMVKKYGRYDAYLYIDSGITFTDKDQIKKLVDLHFSGPYGMTSARTQDDMGFNDWFGTDMIGHSLFNDGNLVVPIGKACNLHCQIFSKELFDFYGRCLPDIFAGQCMESVFSFMCAPLKQKWVVSKEVLVHHSTGLDVPSVGFSPAEHVMKGGKRWDHLFIRQGSILDIIEKGKDLGMGYEEVQKIVLHDESKYDKDGYTDIRLAEYIRDNLFLSTDELDYSKLKYFKI